MADAFDERPHEREIAGILIGMTYQTADRLAREKQELLTAIRGALDELGVPDDGYLAPVANAVGILTRVLVSIAPEAQS